MCDSLFFLLLQVGIQSSGENSTLSLNLHKEKLHRRFTIQKESFSLFFPTTIHSVQKGGKKCTGALVRERKFHQKTSFVLCADATIFACQRHQRVDDDHCDDDYLLVCFCY